MWSVVLAAGHGRRLASVTRGTPKQFWRAPNRPSLLEETFARLAPLAPPERTTVVIDQTHRCYVPGEGRWARWLLYQPEDRGTAAGVLLALSPVVDSTTDAVVVLTPSDHGVADSARFRAGILHAASVVRSGKVDAVLFGVEPGAPVADYGWITPGPAYQWTDSRSLRRVAGFVEKPTADCAHRLFDAKAV
jgi:mannose-1-phosphate guanylyltransferase